jgi:predicted DNA-binding transcriptional regulator AlpA
MMQANVNNEGHKTLFEKKYWTIQDVVAFTQLAKGTIYNLCSADKIPHQKKRKRLIFHPQEILNWLYTED